MADDFKMQVNFRVGGALINLRGQTEEELDAALNWFDKATTKIAGLQGLADAAYNVAAPERQTSQAPAQSAPAQQASAPAGDGGSCPHGPRVYKTGQGKRGKWEAWMCPTRVQGCDPVWI